MADSVAYIASLFYFLPGPHMSNSAGSTATPRIIMGDPNVGVLSRRSGPRERPRAFLILFGPQSSQRRLFPGRWVWNDVYFFHTEAVDLSSSSGSLPGRSSNSSLSNKSSRASVSKVGGPEHVEVEHGDGSGSTGLRLVPPSSPIHLPTWCSSISIPQSSLPSPTLVQFVSSPWPLTSSGRRKQGLDRSKPTVVQFPASRPGSNMFKPSRPTTPAPRGPVQHAVHAVPNPRRRQVKSIFVNIFGGIARCDHIAEAVVAGVKAVGGNAAIKPLVIRLEGAGAAQHSTC